MVKSLVSKLSSASSNISLSSTLSSVSASLQSVGGGAVGVGVQETNYLKHRNDPGRFFGDGVQFKAKLIGILEVGEARGDRMCQEALQDLKMAIRAAGEHKQRITIHVTIDGLRLRDEKTGDSLYHHPVHKISFIAQDMTDSRAFGYIFGSPDSGHRFFGIKTDKAASQVVLAMRDLFQVVFELKKKEIELARQQIQSKSIHDHLTLSSMSTMKTTGSGQNDLSGSGVNNSSVMLGNSYIGTAGCTIKGGYGGSDTKNMLSGHIKEMSPESVADLVDLEQELNSIQRGITQMERITPSDPIPSLGSGSKSGAANEDPFGDSFTSFPTYNLLPPPESSRSRTKPSKPPDNIGRGSCDSTSVGANSVGGNVSGRVAMLATTVAPIGSDPLTSGASPANLHQDDDDSWLQELDRQNDVFDTSKTSFLGMSGLGLSSAPLAPCETVTTPTNQQLAVTSVSSFDGSTIRMSSIASTAADAISSSSQSDQTQSLQQALKSEICPGSGDTADIDPTKIVGTEAVMLPRDTDPFSPTRKKSDPFQEGGDLFSKMDPFEFEFPSATVDDSNMKSSKQQEQHIPHTSPATSVMKKSKDVFNGPLQVSLPPESSAASITSHQKHAHSQWNPNERSEVSATSVMGNHTSIRSRPTSSGAVISSTSPSPSSVFKQQTVDVISSISNKKMPHLFGQATRFSKRESNSINMRRLQESDSLSENEAAPEPPPRPDSALYVEPPPLPPKKQFSDIVIRPRFYPSTASSNQVASGRYEFLTSAPTKSITSGRMGSSSGGGGSDVPPIPLPSRRVGRSDGTYPGPGRPRKPGYGDDDYLAPIENINVAAGGLSADVPPLLPPPTHSSTRSSRNQRQQAVKPQDIYENKLEIMNQQRNTSETESTSSTINPDITLSQLLTLSIDDLAVKLNVPTSKLNTMTLVELTAYLAEFIEKSTKPSTSCNTVSKTGLDDSLNSLKEAENSEEMSAIFKVNFDQEATFVASFDDNFGEDQSIESGTFCADFAQFNESSTLSGSNLSIPPADRYAVFREIIDQELQQKQEDTDLIGDIISEGMEDNTTNNLSSVQAARLRRDSTQLGETLGNVDNNLLTNEPQIAVLPKFDTKITEVVAQAKDRYAALRDIILVENLFDKQAVNAGQDAVLGEEFADFENENNVERDRDRQVCTSVMSIDDIDDDDDEDEDGGAGESSLDSNEKESGGIGSDRCCELLQDQYEKLSTSTQQLEVGRSDQYGGNGVVHSKQDSNFLMVSGRASGLATNSKDDLEIDDLMQRAISNLSLDSRERTSPSSAAHTATNTAKSDTTITKKTPDSTQNGSPSLAPKTQFNDVSTSPIPGSSQQNQIQKANIAQLSPIPIQQTAASSLIDTASKQLPLDQNVARSKESWATFDSPKSTTLSTAASTAKSSSRSQKVSARRRSKSPKGITLHLPPPPPSNTSQNDTAESPCSSDPRDDGWAKTGRRWSKQDRNSGCLGNNAQQTSSSSRDASPWDDETGPEAYSKQRRGLACNQQQQHAHPDRHGYYIRHIRRMNSCDEDYEYEGEFGKRREQRKFKQGISRSRDNFEFDSSSWYHQPPPHSWSPQDDGLCVGVNSRARSFDRSVFERSTYGPSSYDKRGTGLTSATSSYDRRACGGYDKRKYYRDYSRPNYDIEGYHESPHQERRHRRDYENIYDPDSRSFMGYGGKLSRGVDYVGYECDRKSFDRESVESFESSTHRCRGFGSGDVSGSLESREEFRDRYINVSPDAKTTRSLRKSGLKTSRNTTGEIDYEQDSDVNEGHQQQRSNRGPPPTLDSRGLQRPNQLGSIGSISGGGQQRLRKSSGSSPWDGEEPGSHLGDSVQSSSSQKAWKRPSSAAESERRIVESRRAVTLAQTPSGSDGEKDRRFRRKQRSRGKDVLPMGVSSTNRYMGSGQNAAHSRDNYDYMTYANDDDDIDDDDEDDYADEEYEEPPTDEDKFERLNRRRHEMHQRMLESEHRRQHSTMCKSSSGVKSIDVAGNIKYQRSPRASEFDDFDDIQTSASTPRSGGANISSSSAAVTIGTKFNFDDQSGFESDFNQSNSPPPPPQSTAGTVSGCIPAPSGTVTVARGNSITSSNKSSFRFSNDFSEREKLQNFTASNTAYSQQSELVNKKPSVSPVVSVTEHSTPPPITQKLRFDDNVKISKFDNNINSTFEDDFSKAEFEFEKADQWSAEVTQQAVRSMKKTQTRSSKLQQRQDLIKKSESINIFAKKSEDPFEDDEFFNAPNPLSLEDVIGKEEQRQQEKPQQHQQQQGSSGGAGDDFQWVESANSFAKFDENM